MALIPGGSGEPTQIIDGLVGKGTLANVETIGLIKILTDSDRRVQILSSSGMTRVVKLPSTNIFIGEVWTIMCASTSAFSLDVQSDNGDLIANLLPGESLVFTSNIANPISSANWSKLTASLFLPSGTLTAPSIKFTGAGVNAGIYAPGVNQISIQTDNTDRFIVDANGNVIFDTNTLFVDAVNNRVGVGTSTPITKFHVEDSATTTTNSIMSVVSGNNASSIIYFGDTDNRAIANLRYDHGTGIFNFQSSQSGSPLTLFSATSLGQVILGHGTFTNQHTVNGGLFINRSDAGANRNSTNRQIAATSSSDATFGSISLHAGRSNTDATHGWNHVFIGTNAAWDNTSFRYVRETTNGGFTHASAITLTSDGNASGFINFLGTNIAGNLEINGRVSSTGAWVWGRPVAAGVDGVAHIMNTGDQGNTFAMSSANAGSIRFCNSSSISAVPSIVGVSNDTITGSGLQLWAGTSDGNTAGDMVFVISENDNTDHATATNDAFRFRRGSTNIASATRAGEWIFGPISGTVSHRLNVGGSSVGTLFAAGASSVTPIITAYQGTNAVSLNVGSSAASIQTNTGFSFVNTTYANLTSTTYGGVGTVLGGFTTAGSWSFGVTDYVGAHTMNGVLLLQRPDTAVYSATSSSLTEPSGTTLVVRNSHGTTTGTYAGIRLSSRTSVGTDVHWNIGSVSGAGATFDADLVFTRKTGVASYAEYSRLTSSGGWIFGANGFTGDHAFNGRVVQTDVVSMQAPGRSAAWGSTSGISTGAFNAVMGTSSSATWLLSGTSNGTFRGGLQLLDTGNTMRLYTNATEYLQIDSSGTTTLLTGNTAVDISGNAATVSTVVDTGSTARYIPFISGSTAGSYGLRVTSALSYTPSTDTIATNISGNAGTVTNGVYTTNNQNIGGIKTLTDFTKFSKGATFTGGGASLPIAMREIMGYVDGKEFVAARRTVVWTAPNLPDGSAGKIVSVITYWASGGNWIPEWDFSDNWTRVEGSNGRDLVLYNSSYDPRYYRLIVFWIANQATV